MIQDTLQSIGLPCAYSHFRKPVNPPFLVYLGNGQTTFGADNTWHYTNNEYQIEYYFTEKTKQMKKPSKRHSSEMALIMTRAKMPTSKVRVSSLFITTYRRNA